LEKEGDIVRFGQDPKKKNEKQGETKKKAKRTVGGVSAEGNDYQKRKGY